MKILGLAICFAIMMGAFLQIGLHLFLDLNSALFVLGGAVGFLVMKNDPKNHITNFWSWRCLFWMAGNSRWVNSNHR